ADFNSQGFNGSGTIDDPYRIEGFDITASSGKLIYISGTTVYFRIVNNYINGLTTATFGIYLVNVQHGTIVNNTASNFSNDGIYIESSNSITVANNTCTFNDEGINLHSCSSSNVINNVCNNNRGVAKKSSHPI
ncbi:MAG: right-handed parallel beta-helix repeat-containing protein, partial [Candidatus Hodarchaeales archaeon]